MSAETIFANARMVLDDEIVAGSLQIRAGRIAALDHGAATMPGAIDLDGDYLVPGLVELHTDNLEKHFSPRPGVKWPGLAAVLQHDAQIAAAGITTVFDAVSLGDIHQDSDRIANLAMTIRTILAARDHDALRSDHRLHLRCEVSHQACVDYYRELADNPLVELVSVMDHTPGQRQFVSLDKFRVYYQKQHGLDDEQFFALQARRLEAHHTHSGPNRRAIVGLAQARGHRLASHDDATGAHVAEAVADGMTIAEFPTTEDAAAASRAGGLRVLMGAPNIVLGGSHSGNASAAALARAGMLDILSSDYVPGSLMLAAFGLPEAAGIGLPAAIAMVAHNPARAVGLDDRGSVAPGKRADLVRVREIAGMPVIRGVWREGERVV